MQVVGSSKLNAKGLVNTEQAYKGILDCFSNTYKEARIRGLYRGVGMGFKTAYFHECRLTLFCDFLTCLTAFFCHLT